jgi:peptidyl-prolyl cis-trans isomerase A (cyclophilin A)
MWGMKPARLTALVALTLALGTFAVMTGAQQAPSPQPKKDLTNPKLFTEKAPDVYLAQFDTSVGTFIVRVTRNWAPNGADRFYNLVKSGFYDECRFFRVVPTVLVQFGINGDPAVSSAWEKAYIKQDRARMSNTRGRLSFAAASTAQASDQDTRATQVFINYGDNNKMDLEGFAAFGQVITSMVMVERIFDKYGEGPDPALLMSQGNAWLIQAAPQMDYIKTATIAEGQ